jgi:hypothetical protein
LTPERLDPTLKDLPAVGLLCSAAERMDATLFLDFS